jgi:hypothetical protein
MIVIGLIPLQDSPVPTVSLLTTTAGKPPRLADYPAVRRSGLSAWQRFTARSAARAPWVKQGASGIPHRRLQSADSGQANAHFARWNGLNPVSWLMLKNENTEFFSHPDVTSR